MRVSEGKESVNRISKKWNLIPRIPSEETPLGTLEPKPDEHPRCQQLKQELPQNAKLEILQPWPSQSKAITRCHMASKGSKLILNGFYGAPGFGIQALFHRIQEYLGSSGRGVQQVEVSSLGLRALHMLHTLSASCPKL